jgi:hypothetical protein
MFDGITSSLLFDKTKNSIHNTTMRRVEEFFLPAHQMQSVDVEDVLLPLIHLALDPMSVEVSEEMVDVLRSGSVSIPLSDVEAEKCFI